MSHQDRREQMGRLAGNVDVMRAHLAERAYDALLDAAIANAAEAAAFAADCRDLARRRGCAAEQSDGRCQSDVTRAGHDRNRHFRAPNFRFEDRS